MVSLFVFAMTAYGMAPYLVASFNSGLACENAKSAIMSASLEQTVSGTSSYSLTPRNMKCISTPGLMAGGARPPEVTGASKIVNSARAPAPAPVTTTAANTANAKRKRVP